jgi:hypothetical protein
MRNFLKKIIVIQIIQLMCIGQTFSSTRVDTVISEDSEVILYELGGHLEELKDLETEISGIEKHLKLTNKGKNIYLKFETIAGAVVAVVVMIGAYKAHFPPGFRAMIGAYITVTGVGRGLIKLSEKEVNFILLEILRLKKSISESELNLKYQIKFYCKENTDNPVCRY